MLKKVGMICLIAVAAMVGLWAQPRVAIEMDAAEYHINDLVKARVLLLDNPGLHNIFFYVEYDESVLAFQEVREGSLPYYERDGELLYADNSGSTGFSESRVAVSFSLTEPELSTDATRGIADIYFRVIGSSVESRQLTFSGGIILDRDKNRINDVIWEDSGLFALTLPIGEDYIRIRRPTHNQAVYSSQVNVSLICSRGDYVVKLFNNTTHSTPREFSVTSGSLYTTTGPDPVDTSIGLQPGLNEITAELYAADYLAEAVTSHTVQIFCSTNQSDIQILSPLDHALINSDTVEVEVDSALSRVTINGEPAETVNGYFVRKINLQRGFNTITATGYMADPQYSGITFKDSIQVYYQKDSHLFRFVTPEEGQAFKAGAYHVLKINGEIDSLYRPLTDPFELDYEENAVTMEITHYPYSVNEAPVSLYNPLQNSVIIGESINPAAQSPYCFGLEHDISLEGMSDGEIEIIAYKNKRDNTWDDKITRYVYVDNQRLWINLVQPNVYSSDLLDSRDKLEKFNGVHGTEIVSDEILISDEGIIGLKADTTAIEAQDIGMIKDMVQAPDGSLYALVNDLSSKVVIYKKVPGGKEWFLFDDRDGLAGYSLAYSRLGLLLGASNIPSNGNSGLYLLNETGEGMVNWTNFEFEDDTLDAIQFITIQGDRIYLYGSLYKHLYSFTPGDLSESGGKLAVNKLQKIGFENTAYIEDFILMQDARGAVLRTDDAEGNIRFFSRQGASFGEDALPGLGNTANLSGTAVVYGSYRDSSYDAFVIAVNSNTAETIMKNRNTGDYFRRNLALEMEENEALAGVGFKDNQFYFILENKMAGMDYEYTLRRGQVFFERVFDDLLFSPESYALETGASIGKIGQEVFFSETGAFYLGMDPGNQRELSDQSTYCFSKKYLETGNCRFDYLNRDIEGLTGFSFEVESRWLQSAGNIDFGFGIYYLDENGDEVEGPVKLLKTDLSTLLDRQDAGSLDATGYVLSHSNDEKTEKIHVEFSHIIEHDESKTYFIRFALGFASSGQESPSLSGLEIFKKIAARITGAGGDILELPIQGYVYDRTVKQVTIMKDSFTDGQAEIGRNGSFHYLLPLRNVENASYDISVKCSNSLEDARADFTVDIIKLTNKLWDMEYEFVQPEPEALSLAEAAFPVRTNIRKLDLSGSYFGVSGAMVGYELRSEDHEVLARGIFTKTVAKDTEYDNLIAAAGLGKPGTGYEAGYFSGQIMLEPNKQYVVVYIENPGGYHYEYKVNESQYPSFIYTMPGDVQKIKFEAGLPLDSPLVIGSGIDVSEKIRFTAAESQNPPYSFSCSNAVVGSIDALEQFEKLLVKSYSPGILFENGSDEIIIGVETGNRFAIPFSAQLGNQVTQTFNLAVIPTIPVYNFMKKGVQLEITKDFEDTHFVPDFSLIRPHNWTEEQMRTFNNILIQFQFEDNREDLPLDGSVAATLRVNFDKANEFTGIVDKMDADTYCLRDAAGEIMDLKGIIRGRNRIQWTFTYEDQGNPENPGAVVMSSSLSGKDGMHDEVFEVVDNEVILPTETVFEPALQDVYYDNTPGDDNETPVHPFPLLKITKYPSSRVELFLNGDAVHKLTADDTNPEPYEIRLDGAAFKQGRNTLVVETREKSGVLTTDYYSFLYDSIAPLVSIATMQSSEDFSRIVEIKAQVKEANYNRAYLHYGSDILNLEPRVILTSDDSCELLWTGLTLDPVFGDIYVEVRDKAGKTASVKVKGFADLEERPEAVEEREQEIKLPIYDGEPVDENGVSLIGNEYDYEKKPFPEHTKFAPAKLLEKISVMEEIKDNDGNLIENMGFSKVLAPDLQSGDAFGTSVAISGDYAVIGASYEDGGDGDPIMGAGAAYIYERQTDGTWGNEQILHAFDLQGGDNFGCSVAISGDYVIIGADYEDGGDGDPVDRAGAAYIYERQPDGIWGNEQILHASDLQGRDYFGSSVAISGDYVIIGAYHEDGGDGDPVDGAGAAYIYERQPDGIWGNEQILHASDFQANDRFGCSVAISGDYAIIGAYYEKGGDGDQVGWAGAAYIFERQPDGTWGNEQILHASDLQANARFGCSVAISGNYVIIGADHEDGGVDDSIWECGAAYIFERQPDGIWGNEQILHASDLQGGDNFGCSVAISGDYVIIGADHEEGGDGDSVWAAGAAYIFERQTDGTWGNEQILHASDLQMMDSFGISVAISGNYAITGAAQVNLGIDTLLPGSGVAYIYDRGTVEGQPTLSEDSILDQYNKKYLVFRIKKTENFQSTDSLTINDKDVIRFRTYGLQQEMADEHPITTIYPNVPENGYLEIENCAVIDGLQYLYYMVEIEELKSDFLTAANSLAALFDPDSSIVNQGILELEYHPLALNQGLVIEDIYVTGNTDASAPAVESDFSDIVVYDIDYQDKEATMDEDGNIPLLFQHELYIDDTSQEDRTAFLSGDTDEFSLSFWLRIEDENILDCSYGTAHKRILTLLNEEGDEGVYLDYTVENEKPVLDFFHFAPGFDGSLYGPEEEKKPLDTDSGENVFDRMKIWNFITLTFKLDTFYQELDIELNIQYQDNDFSTSVTTVQPAHVFSYSIGETASLGELFTRLSFGPEEGGTGLNTGFFSIADPKYINRLLTDDEIIRYTNLYYENPVDLVKSFNDPRELDDLEMLSEDGTAGDAFIEYQNADYAQTGSGAFKGSSLHRNFFKKRGDSEHETVIFQEAGTAVFHNLVPLGGYRQFTLDLNDTAAKGFYYFGDKNSNYGLGASSWYSITGDVISLQAGKQAWICMAVNGVEQRMELPRDSSFHFIYTNPANMIPDQVKVYIETSGDITLGTNMILNHGYYKLPEVQGEIQDYASTAASTTFAFDISGSIDLWYKPFIVNAEGFINENVVILDSEYVRLGSKLVNGEAYYQAYIKDINGNVKVDLCSNVKIHEAWTHLQVAWDVDHAVVYFYIDGKIAAFAEGDDADLGTFGTLDGIMPEKDNLYLGCNKQKTIYAEGYLDEINVSKYYAQSKYQENNLKDRQPLSLVFDETAQQIQLEETGAFTVETGNINYQLHTTGGCFIEEGGSFPVSLLNREGGRYRLAVNMTVNGYAWDDRLTFNLDSKPRFENTGHTPFLFSGEPTPLYFGFEYDHSYVFDNENLVYAGLGLQIADPVEVEPPGEVEVYQPVKEVYLVQDFLSQDSSSWLIGEAGESGAVTSWQPFEPRNDGRLQLVFNNFESAADLSFAYDTFYFTSQFDEELVFSHRLDKDNIPLATLQKNIEPATTIINIDGVDKEFEYVVSIGLEGTGRIPQGLLSDIAIEFEAYRQNDNLEFSGERELSLRDDEEPKAYFYYDDVFGEAYGTYDCTFRLKYKGITYATRSGIVLTWKQIIEPNTDTAPVKFEIDEFSLCRLDKEAALADFYLQYTAEGVVNLDVYLEIRQDGERFGEHTYLDVPNTQGYLFMGDTVPISVPPEGSYLAKIRIETTVPGGAEHFVRTAYLELETEPVSLAPEVLFTNSVDSSIAYNDVFFSWKGFIKTEDGERRYNSDIEYSYSFDSYTSLNSGDALWSAWSGDWRSVRYYNLEDGYHSFYIKARYDGKETSPLGNTFFVDIHRPVFDMALIEPQHHFDSQGNLDSVSFIGKSGAISDASLRDYILVEGETLDINEDGSFMTGPCFISRDGTTNITLTAFDKVGSYRDQIIPIDNFITGISYPVTDLRVKYSPLTIMGKINEEIRSGMEIYVLDPFGEEGSPGNFQGWKKGVINSDRTFFVENVMINPGTAARQVPTTLRIATVFETGKIYERELEVRANLIVMPIEMVLSAHAVEGETKPTAVKFTCFANVPDVSSWSIDYDGDGVYDDIELQDNPAAAEAMNFERTHVYSNVKQRNPRVRVITTDGNIFSVSQNLIIHEQIKDASHKLITSPVSMSTFTDEDYSEKIYVLKEQMTGEELNHVIDIFEIGQDADYISQKLDSINLSALEIESPFLVRALDKDHLIVASHMDEHTGIYELETNRYGTFGVRRTLTLDEKVRDITVDKSALYLSFEDRNYLSEIPLKDNLLPETYEPNREIPDTRNAAAMGTNVSLAKDDMGLLVADYYNQRLLRFTDSYRMLEQCGSYGTGEKEFLTPSLVRTLGDRVFVFDETRMDIQIFDLYQDNGSTINTFVPICTLNYNREPGYPNYLEAGFFNEIADMSIVVRSDGYREYFYALVLSRSTGKLAMLRIPQYKELRARVRNNKLAFIQDGEILTAKPNGSDLRKILSSDSLPRIEGALDYPALSPDGRVMAFTSRLDLYIGKYFELENTGNPYAYDHIYLYDIEARNLEHLDLGELAGYKVERPVFNSNGNTLIFSAKKMGGLWQLYTCDFSSGQVNRVFESDENARFPYYSPDDRFIVFTTDYDGDEDIVIMDTQNANIRVQVTNNNARDSYPVWISVYPGEIADADDMIQSKIAYVSERDYEKDLYSVYIARYSNSDIRVVKETGTLIGSDPDSAARRLTPQGVEGDYPCFVGDSKSVVFEHYENDEYTLKQYNYTYDDPEDDDDELMMSLDYFDRARRPAGMKNSITNFTAENKNGDEILLNWNSYGEGITYTVQYKLAGSEEGEYVEKCVRNQTTTRLQGVSMGSRYMVRVCIIENNAEAASSQWHYVEIPEVVAKPSYEIDAGNPYLVHFHAWTPPEEYSDDEAWRFAWIIDNNEMNVQTGPDWSYEFATSGEKIVKLKAWVGASNYDTVDYSDDFIVKIESDIQPTIDYILAQDGSYLELDCKNSPGQKIDWSSATWTITGPNGGRLDYYRSRVIADLDAFVHKVIVSLSLKRISVNGQQTTDELTTHKVIDLDFKDLKPVISISNDPDNNRLVHFSGRDSLGSIDWHLASWTIFSDSSILYQKDGVATLDYFFSEFYSDRTYSISLTIPQKDNGMTETVSQIITVEAAAVEPQIDYDILNLETDGQIVGQKVIFDCTKSRGSNIDFAQARWSIPSALNYNEQPVQIGPVAVYNLTGIEDKAHIDVSLTLYRHGGLDGKTINRTIVITGDELVKGELVVTPTITETSEGKTIVFDALQSTGTNILWDRTVWLLDGQYTRNGSSVRYDVPASAGKKIIPYHCTLYRQGGEIQVEEDTIEIEEIAIEPFINTKKLAPHVYQLDVLKTRGTNIDWDRTRWYIHDGNQDVVVKQGALITHAFALQEDKMGYPVFVEMFLKGDTFPFVHNKTIYVEGDIFIPNISTMTDKDVDGAVLLSAENSVGSNIDWSQVKWTILETAQTLYGPVISYKFPPSDRREYTVVLTLTRSLPNGKTEVKSSDPYPVSVTPAKIVPKISAWKEEYVYEIVDGEEIKKWTLFLSAENSTGRGLLLDRATWCFTGAGDSVTSKDQGGTMKSGSFGWTENLELQAWVEGGVSFGGPYSKNAFSFAPAGYLDIGGRFSTDTDWQWGGQDISYDYSNYYDNTISTANSSVGPVCRRPIDDDTSSVIVVLYVYRMTSDGGVEGKSITVQIMLNELGSEPVTWEAK